MSKKQRVIYVYTERDYERARRRWAKDIKQGRVLVIKVGGVNLATEGTA